MYFKIFSIATVLAFSMATQAQAVIKVACVGNSITEGMGIWDKKKYPEHLQDMLGSEYKVENFGHSSQMFRKNSSESYWKSPKFTAAYGFEANIVVIELGTNDSKYYFNGQENYYEKNVDRNEMLKDYEALIDTFAKQPQAPKIYATLQPYANNFGWFITDTAIVNQINPIIKEAAENKGAILIDLHTEFNNKDWLLDDMVHPNEIGAKKLAQIIANALQNKSMQNTSSSTANVETSSSKELAKSSSSESAISSTTSTMENSSSSKASENFNSSSTSSTKILDVSNAASSRIYKQVNKIVIKNYVGKVSIFDLNGNHIKSVHCNGFTQIPVNQNGMYIVKKVKGTSNNCFE